MSDQVEMRSAPLLESEPTAKPAAAPENPDDRNGRRFEVLTGVLLAIWAATLAACDIGGDNADINCLQATNQSSNAYAWYQSKSIKQDMTNSEAALLETLTATSHYDAATSAGLQKRLDEAHKDVERYKKEKDEILRGSDKVGQDNWVQDVDGKLGQVTGAEEYQAQANDYNNMGNIFDLGSLLLQVSLAIGALSLLFNQRKLRQVFFWGMNLLAASGTYFCVIAYIWAFKVGMFDTN